MSITEAWIRVTSYTAIMMYKALKKLSEKLSLIGWERCSDPGEAVAIMVDEAVEEAEELLKRAREHDCNMACTEICGGDSYREDMARSTASRIRSSAVRPHRPGRATQRRGGQVTWRS